MSKIEDFPKDSQRFFVIGDPHFKKSYLKEGRELVLSCLEAVAKIKPDRIVILGDTLHTHEIVHTQCYNIAIDFIKKLSLISKVYLLIGNHDILRNNLFLTEHHPFNALKEWDNVVVVDKPVYEMVDGITFMFCPYTPNGRFEEALNTTISDNFYWEDDVDYIFAHQEFKGCDLSNKRISTDGDVWDDESLPIVISGHIHQHQVLNNGRIIYTGSPMQTRFGEDFKKGPFVFQFEKKKLKYEMINLNLTLKIQFEHNISNMLENVDSIKREKEKGNDVKIKLKDATADINVFMKTSEYEKLKNLGIKFDVKFDDIEAKKDDRYKNLNLFEIFSKYVENENDNVRKCYKELITDLS